MVKLTLEDKEKNKKFFLFESTNCKTNIYFKEFNLSKFNILTDVEFITINGRGDIDIEDFLLSYKDHKKDLKDIFKYMLFSNFSRYKIKILENLIMYFYKTKTIREMYEFSEKHIIVVMEENLNNYYYFREIQQVITNYVIGNIRNNKIDLNLFYTLKFNNKLHLMMKYFEIKKEKCIADERFEAFIISKEKIYEKIKNEKNN